MFGKLVIGSPRSSRALPSRQPRRRPGVKLEVGTEMEVDSEIVAPIEAMGLEVEPEAGRTETGDEAYDRRYDPRRYVRCHTLPLGPPLILSACMPNATKPLAVRIDYTVRRLWSLSFLMGKELTSPESA